MENLRTAKRDTEKEFKEEPLSSLMKLDEFLIVAGRSRQYLVESLGSFSYWMRKQGRLVRLPFGRWEEELKLFLKRKVK